ncbi:hypothetical protein CAPTEDRAFT_201695 [Capitella teleta]|uniref:EGF-like domain-containing protein n=1 Tax=Capitella teleta TaxID=283909 RepID=R7TP86_CAPTE|nr:hypothetical protein CAPTEDRAFT_201695 [Capitella teleta]|eukprot:ELT92850.1 hypothetical protein CAPTEDRAFT_201695 [Capitella teleta]
MTSFPLPFVLLSTWLLLCKGQVMGDSQFDTINRPRGTHGSEALTLYADYPPRYDCATNIPCDGRDSGCSFRFLHVNPNKYIECAPVPPFDCSEQYCEAGHEYNIDYCLCEVADPCEFYNQPCKNSADCIKVGHPDDYYCDCKDGWTGTNCDTEVPGADEGIPSMCYADSAVDSANEYV